MAGGTDTVVLEAEQLIQRWLDNVEHAMEDTPAAQEADYLSSLDWGEGEVGENARTVISGLMGTELPGVKRSAVTTERKMYDPRVAMEMRHQEVRKRRKERDKKRAHQRHCDELAREVLREAEDIVKSEEERARVKAEEDEVLIQQQMAVIRRQLKEERESMKRQRVEEKERVEREKTTRALVQAERLIKSERKRLQTRAELLRQLKEAELVEAKNDVRLVHQCFTRWLEVAIEQRAKLRKAETVSNWSLMLRMWCAWRRFVSKRRERRERDQLARRLQREKRLFQVATEHYIQRLCQRVLCGWRSEVRRGREERRLQEERSRHRNKMEALLEAAARRENRIKEAAETVEDQVSEQTKKESKETSAKPLKKKTPADVAVWKKARQHLDHLLSSVSPPPSPEDDTNSPPQNHSRSHQPNITHESIQSLQSQPPPPSSGKSESICQEELQHGSRLTQQPPEAVQPTAHTTRSVVALKKPKPKPVTKPLAMSGMESRTAEMAKRKALREERRLQAEREKAERLIREQEMRRVAEMEAKEALAAQRREERKRAKQQELERLARQKAMAELLEKATHHYHTALLRHKGLEPWKRFIAQARSDSLNADKLRVKLQLVGVFRRWREVTRDRLKEKEDRADGHHLMVALRKTMAAWKQYVADSKELEVRAVASRPTLLMRCVFRAWMRETRKERMEWWEKMARARRFRERHVACSVFRAWKRFVPLSKEERIREGRRAELRRKVATWLQDYQPVSTTA